MRTSELREQVLLVNEILIDQEIFPPSLGEKVFSMTEEELKSKFPRRWEIFRRILDDQKRELSQVADDELDKISKWLYVVNSLDRYLVKHNQSESGSQTLWEKQLTVFGDIRSFLEQGGTEGYVKLPTGTGKTVIFSELIEAVGLRTLIVVPKRILVEQTTGMLADFTEDLDIGRVYAETKEHGRQVTVITYQSLVEGLKSGRIQPEAYDFVILDEAHKALSYHRVNAIRRLHALFKVGFTATHWFSDKKQVSNVLATKIHSMSIEEAVREGLLCSYSVILVETGTDISEVPVMTTGDYNPERLERAINIAGRNKGAVGIYRKMFGGRKAIAYCQGVRHAMDLAKTFLRVGIPAAVIHGKQRIGEQMELKRKLERGEIKILCNSDILIEGFNEPSVSVCLNLRPTLSAVVAEQRGGRILRVDPQNTKKHAVVVDFIDKTRDRKQIQVTFPEVSGASFASNSAEQQSSVFSVDAGSSVIIIGDQKEVKSYVQEMVRRRKEAAPVGWMTSSEIVKFANTRTMVIEHFAEKLRSEHPNWFQNYLVGPNRYREFYSSELVEVIKEEVRAKVIAPLTWKNVAELSVELRRITKTVSKAATRLGVGHPEWFRRYFDASGTGTEYFAPELVDKLREFFSFRPKR